MVPISADSVVSELVTENPGWARVFERFGIDYCCGGGRSLAAACAAAGLRPDEILRELESAEPEEGDGRDWSRATMSELVDHIVEDHHAYLREELPRLAFLVEKVAGVHGDAHPELLEVREVFAGLRAELESHTVKEERVLFPACKELEGAEKMPEFGFGSVRNPISVMFEEHIEAGEGLKRIRSLTRDYVVPEGACNSYRAMLYGLAELERDTHLHVYKENSLLFPRVVAAEDALLERQ
ncbi:MAG: iron-sulfur cluster repair di-iron protein [Actinomycetota bacterium]